VQAWIDQQCRDTARVALYRERLQDLGWLIKIRRFSCPHGGALCGGARHRRGVADASV